MTATLLLACALFAANPQTAKDAADKDAEAPRLQVAKPAVPDPDDRLAAQELTDVRRVYVDVLTGGESAAQLRDMIISSLQKTKLFILTENEDRADAILKGAADDKVFTDTFHSSDNLNMHTQVGGSTNSSGGYRSQNGSSHNAGISVGENESTNIEERKHEAFAAVRLVNRDGDVIWSATEESLGAKFQGASLDVAERITKQLALDYRRARTGHPPAPAPKLPDSR